MAVGVTAVTVGGAAVRRRACSPTRSGSGSALAVGAAVGALAYSALFLALSLVTRRPVLLGLVYVLIWEGLLGNLVSGTRVLSHPAVRDHARRPDRPDRRCSTASVSLPVAVGDEPCCSRVGVTVLAIDRLRSFSVAGETS